MSSAERRAILLLLGLAVAGHGVRLLLTRPGEAPGAVQLLGGPNGGRDGSPLAQRDSAARAGRPLAPGERIDVDRAPAAELARLPRVGPALARAIVADRAENGPFGSLSGLDRVPRIGPGLLRALEPHVSFSGAAGRPGGPAGRGAGDASPARPIDLNTASPEELDRLPGVGPALARAIVAWRETHGRFASVAELARVPGIGAARSGRIWNAAVGGAAGAGAP